MLRFASSILLAWSLVVPGFAQAVSGRNDAVRTDAGAMVLGPPRPVAVGAVQSMVWSSDGTSLAVLTQDQVMSRDGAIRALTGIGPPEADLGKIRMTVFDRTTQSARQVLELDPRFDEISLMAFPQGSNALLFLANGFTMRSNGDPGTYALIGRATAKESGFTTLKRIDMGAARWSGGFYSHEYSHEHGATEVVPDSIRSVVATASGSVDEETTAMLGLLVSPQFPVGYIVEHRQVFQRVELADGRLVRGGLGPATFTAIQPNGTLGTMTPSRIEAVESVMPGWSGSGDRPIFRVIALKDGRPSEQFLSATSTAPTALHSGPPEMVHSYITEPEAPVRESWTVVERGGTKAAGRSFWLAGRRGDAEVAALIAPFANSAELAPNGSAVAYTTAEGCFLRDVFHMDAETMSEVDRQETMQIAKQMGMALILYATDYDDYLPPGNDLKVVEPYVKNRELLDRFNFTYTGSRYTGDIAAPAETPLGYVLGPGGRAIVYADGHVRWRPDTP